MVTELPEADTCCPSMRLLQTPESQCNIELNEDGRLASCDDDGDRLPPLNYCPWCRAELNKEDDDATQH